MITASTLLDFTGSLAILGLLAAAYGSLHRSLPDQRLTEPVLGALFGMLALVQMHNPVSPLPGFLIDMRNVPIVLAGAYLGMRGLLPCLIIAVFARLEIGGIGAPSGVAAMIIAGGIGLVWSAATLNRPRGLLAILVLGGAASSHMMAVVLLPPDAASWFLNHAALPLAGLNIIAISAVASLLERERRQIAREDFTGDDADIPPGQGVMRRDVLEWSLLQSAETGTLSGGATVIGIRIRFRGALARFWGASADRLAMRAFHDRLSGVTPKGGVVGWARPDLVLMAVPPLEREQSRNFLARIRRDVSADAIVVAGMTPFRLVLDLDTFHYDTVPALDAIVADVQRSTVEGGFTAQSAILKRSGALPVTAMSGLRAKVKPLNGVATGLGAGCELFRTFDKLSDARYGSN